MANEGGQNGSPTPFLNKAWYDRLKFLCIIVLPGIGSLYFGIAQIWGLPKGEEVVGTIAVINTFLGLVLGISTAQYNNSDVKYDGDVEYQKTVTGKTVFTLALKSDDRLEDRKDLTFRVVPVQAPRNIT